MKMFSFLLIFFCIVFDVQSNLVESLQKCPEGTNDCVKNAVKQLYNLITEPNEAIGAEVMDPLFQKLIEEDLEVIKFRLINSTIVGFKACEVEEATNNRAGSTLQVKFFCPKFDQKGLYEMKGRILTEDVEGDGDYILNCGSYKLMTDFNLEKIQSNGKNYIQISGFTFKADPIGRSTYRLNNLFGGDKELGDRLNAFINENWKTVAIAFHDLIFKPNIKRISKNANKYLKTLPID